MPSRESNSPPSSAFAVREKAPQPAQTDAPAQSAPPMNTSGEQNRQLNRTEVDEIAALLGGEGETPAPEVDGEQPAPETEPGDVEGLLAATDDQVEQGEAEPAPVPKRETPKTLKDLADASQLDIETLYGIEITTADGETATLSEMKDAYATRLQDQRENAIAQAQRDEAETADIANRTFVAQMAAQFRDALTPAQHSEMRRQEQERNAREKTMLNATAPELANPQTFSAFQGDAVKLLERYGFTGPEMVITDHRQILMMRDMLKLHKRLKDIASFKPKSKAPGKSKTSGKPANIGAQKRTQAAAAQGSEADKIAAIAELMKG